MTVRTAFSESPVTCALAGAALLRFGLSAIQTINPDDNTDQLFTAVGRLRGRLSFDGEGSPLSWQMPGAVEPLPLASAGAGRIERGSQSVTQGPSFDEGRFPCVLHLRNGEIIPCQVLSCDKTTLGFESPFIKQHSVDVRHIKAIEFVTLKHRKPERRPASETNTWLKDIPGSEPGTLLGVDPAKLERALTVPRFNRSNPPSHLLMAKNGDLKRGSLLGINTQTIEFESKLRTQIVPVVRMACVVNVTKPEQEPNVPSEVVADLTGPARVTLADGSILIFEPCESIDGKLIGRSTLYGDMAIPTDHIQTLSLGGFDRESLTSLFNDWVVHPAQKPKFGEPSVPNHDP
ncbi:MAG: hypothetical protein GY809_04550 [Planctomycetes bacterium]|nr:hypothetical protein [Planctomycetota bacterium]